MKFNAAYTASLILAGILTIANVPNVKAAVNAAAPKKAAPAPAAAAARPIVNVKAPVTPSNNTNGEGVPNGSPSNTGCVDACNVYPPPAPDGNTPNSLEIYYLAWFPSYQAGSTMNMSFWSAYNPAATGTPPTTLNIDLYDQFGKVNLASVAQNVPVKTGANNTPVILEAWNIPSTVNANFNVSNQFLLVFTGANNWRRDRLVQIQGITANPGGGPNPVYANAVSGPPSASSNSAASSTATASTNTAAGVKFDLWVVVCVWTFLVAQVVGFVLV